MPVRTTDPLVLMRDPEVTVIDLATPPDSHAELVDLAARHGKPVLAQKPLCCTPGEFAAFEDVRARGGRVRLNLTGRYVSAWTRVRELLRDGTLGRPTLCTIQNRDWWDREPGRWDHGIEQYIVFEMLIHHLDLCLFWFGLPARMVTRTGTHPGQRMRQANWVTATLEYEDGLVVQIVDDWQMSEFSFSSGHPFEQVLISAEKGALRATSERVELSLLGENAVRTWHLPRPGQHLPGEELATRWFPDSFGAAMQAFMEDVQAGRGADDDWRHLADLTQLTFTAAAAARSNEWVAVGGPAE